MLHECRTASPQRGATSRHAEAFHGCARSPSCCQHQARSHVASQVPWRVVLQSRRARRGRAPPLERRHGGRLYVDQAALHPRAACASRAQRRPGGGLLCTNQVPAHPDQRRGTDQRSLEHSRRQARLLSRCRRRRGPQLSLPHRQAVPGAQRRRLRLDRADSPTRSSSDKSRYSALDLRRASRSAPRSSTRSALTQSLVPSAVRIFWHYRGDAVRGTDAYHFQLGAGVSYRIARRVDVFVEGIPLGERGISGGAAAVF